MPADVSFETRRRAVYTALNQHLSGDHLWEAVAVWEDSYAAAQPFAAMNYLAEILTTPELRLQRLRILQVLLKTLAQPAASLLPDPNEELVAYRRRRAPVVAPVTNSGDPAVRACGNFLTAVLRHLEDDTRRHLRHFVLERLDRSELATPSRNAVRTWLTDSSLLTLPSAEARDLRGLISLFYMGLCEHIGPVAADAALNRAFKKIEESEPALAPQVRNLL